jgi:hypothetical protein
VPLTALPQLGLVRDRLRRWFGKRAVAQLDRALMENDFESIFELIQRVYLGSATSAYGIQGEIAAVPAVDEAFFTKLARAAQEFAARATRLSAGTDLLPPAVQEQYGDLMVDQALAQGHEEGAWQGALRADPPLGWKVWTRIYEAKEPRDWHDALEGSTIARNAKYVLPGGPNEGAEVHGPHDWRSVKDAAEWIHCGHSLIYTPYADWGDLG